MSQKEYELLVDILKNLDTQFTSLKTCLRSGVMVNNQVPKSSYNFLIWATENLENEEILEYLINNGANVNDEWNKITPLRKAIGKKSLNQIKMLLSKGANVNHIPSDGNTALTASVLLNDFPITKYLIEQGADVNLFGFYDRTPLSWAVELRNVEIVRLLIANGANVNKPDRDGKTPLVKGNIAKSLSEAILKKSLIDIELLLANGADINEVDSKGYTPLQHSILSENIEILKRLLKSNANVCKRGGNGKTPLLTAVEVGNSDIVRILLDNGAECTIQSALFEAIRSKNLKFIKMLIAKGAIVNIPCRNGCTPLTKAIETQDVDIVKILVENEVNVNLPQSDVQLKSDTTASFELLLKYIENKFERVQIVGAPPNSIIDAEKDSPLSKAVKLENYEIVKYLVEQGANINQANAEGKVPLAIAASNRDIRIVTFLIRSKANLDLAKEEIEEYVKVDDDFAAFMNSLKNDDSVKNLNLSFRDFGQEAAEDAAD